MRGLVERIIRVMRHARILIHQLSPCEHASRGCAALFAHWEAPLNNEASNVFPSDGLYDRLRDTSLLAVDACW